MAQAPAQSQPEVFGAQLNKNKKSRFWRIAGLSVLAVTATITSWLAFTQQGRKAVDGISKSAPVLLPIIRDRELLFTNVGHDQVNILLVGEDYNWVVKPTLNPKTGKYAPYQQIDKDSPPRSDTIIVLTLDRTDHSMRMLSLPRDARVTYTDLDGDTHRGRKLNAVYSSGGTDAEKRQQLLRQFLSDEMGIRIDRIAVIKPNSFKQLVEMVGGVYVNVDGALKLDKRTGKLYRGHIFYKDDWGGWKVDLDPGPQWLNGEQAHGYVRFRKDREGDPGRIRRQQMVMKAVARRIMDKPILELPDLAKDVQKHFRTDMTDEELGSAALFSRNLGTSEKIQPLTLFGIYAENGDIILNGPKNEKLLATIFGSSFNAKNFLSRSPSTKRDDIGITNNASPGAQEVLRAAGLLDDEEAKDLANSPVLEAPVRGTVNSDNSPDAVASTEGIEPRESRVERPRRAIISEESTRETVASPEPTARPRRKPRRKPAETAETTTPRRERSRIETPVRESAREESSVPEPEPRDSTPAESPIPVAE